MGVGWGGVRWGVGVPMEISPENGSCKGNWSNKNRSNVFLSLSVKIEWVWLVE